MKTVARGLLEFLFPPRCGVCLAFGPEVLCPVCRDAIERLQPPWCATCGTPDGLPHAELLCRTGALDGVRSFGRYRGVLGEAVKSFKFHGRRALGPVLGALLAEFAARPDGPPPAPRDLTAVDIICPVPLHTGRFIERGFNQAHALAHAVAAVGAAPVEPVLERVRPTAFQSGLPPRERIANLRGAFAVPPRVSVRGARILLVDDLITIGATMAECARVLRHAGAVAVYGLSLARAGYGVDDAAGAAPPV